MLSYRSLHSLVPVAVLAITAPSVLSAQELSAAQREVWQFIEECNQRYFEEDPNGVLSCYHDDFAGWQYGDAVPRTKDSVRKLLASEFEASEPVAYDLRPIAIRVFGSFAVAHYSAEWVQKNSAGEVMTLQMIWTDILLKEGNRWSWVGDHGGTVESD